MKNSSPPTPEGTGKQMYLVDLTDVVLRASSIDDAIGATRGIWASLYERMNPEETLWVVAPNDYRDGRLWPVSMAIADAARDESSLKLKNTITLHTWENRGADMENAYDEILFFVKNKREYQFHKDRIRVAHVYQGHEWGGERKEGNSAYHDRKVTRYNDDGKDPGNVWLEEDRTQTDDQEVDETESISLEEGVRRCVLVGSEHKETVYLINGGGSIRTTVTNEGREVEELDIEALRRGVQN